MLTIAKHLLDVETRVSEELTELVNFPHSCPLDVPTLCLRSGFHAGRVPTGPDAAYPANVLRPGGLTSGKLSGGLQLCVDPDRGSLQPLKSDPEKMQGMTWPLLLLLLLLLLARFDKGPPPCALDNHPGTLGGQHLIPLEEKEQKPYWQHYQAIYIVRNVAE